MAKRNNQIKKDKFYISGMHCASCKGIIEDRLTEQDEVQSAEVDLKMGTIEIDFNKKILDAQTITKKFEDVGYVFSKEPIQEPLYKKIIIIVIVFVGVSIALMQSEKFMMLNGGGVNENSSLFAFIILGIVASLSSCVALVGGILLAMTKSWIKTIGKNASFSQKMEPHVKFHIGRLVAYFIGGGLLGVLGNFITFNNLTFYAVLTLIIAIIMLLVGLQMLGVKWVLRLYVHAYENTFKKIRINKKIKDKSPFIAGAATFFIPCGFTLIAQGIALTTGGFIAGAAIMSAFAVGTLPVLIGVSLGGTTMIDKKGFESIFNTIIGTIIVIFAIYILNGQFNVLGLPSFNDINFRKIKNVEQIDDAIIDEQELNVIADKFEYTVVGSKTLKAGVPTTIIVDNQGVVGCGAFMTARGLFDGRIDLKPGINKKKFIPKVGTYKLTCTMGMVPPVTIIVK